MIPKEVGDAIAAACPNKTSCCRGESADCWEGPAYQTGAWAGTKDAWVWVFAAHPYTKGYPGTIGGGDLFFSSPEKFKELLGRPMDDYEALLKVRVPRDFDNWDYVPNDY